ncbi:MAG: nuclear transport factor 2 family protein, partial [Brevundimonas sp.]
QYSHEPFLAVRRFQKVYQGHADADIEPRLLAKGLEALEVMETHLRDRAWFAGRRPSLADLALLPYTRFAPDGGFDLAGFPNVRGWVARALAAFGVEDPAVVLPAEPRSPSPEADATFTGYGPDAAAAFCDRWLPAWTGGDAARLAEFYTDDAVYADPARPDGVVGRAALLLYFDRLLARFPDWVWTHDRSPPIPHGFVNFWTCRLADPERAFSGVCLVQLRNGRIFRNEVFFDPSALKRTPDA